MTNSSLTSKCDSTSASSPPPVWRRASPGRSRSAASSRTPRCRSDACAAPCAFSCRVGRCGSPPSRSRPTGPANSAGWPRTTLVASLGPPGQRKPPESWLQRRPPLPAEAPPHPQPLWNASGSPAARCPAAPSSLTALRYHDGKAMCAPWALRCDAVPFDCSSQGWPRQEAHRSAKCAWHPNAGMTAVNPTASSMPREDRAC